MAAEVDVWRRRPTQHVEYTRHMDRIQRIARGEPIARQPQSRQGKAPTAERGPPVVACRQVLHGPTLRSRFGPRRPSINTIMPKTAIGTRCRLLKPNASPALMPAITGHDGKQLGRASAK